LNAHGELLPESAVVAYPIQSDPVHRPKHNRKRAKANQLNEGIGDAFCAVPADVADHLASAHAVTDVYRILQVQRLDQRRKIIGMGVKLVAVPGLTGSAMLEGSF
jgi:hypothetical protein